MFKSKKVSLKEINEWWIYKDATAEGLYCYVCIIDKCALGYQTSICDKFVNVNAAWNNEIAQKYIYSDHTTAEFKYFITDIESLEEWKTWISQNDINIVFETAESTFVPLTSAEQEQLNTLHTNYPTTVMINDQGCNMKLTYKTKKSLEVTT